CKRPKTAKTSSKLVTILIRFNMVSLSCGPMQDFRPGKEKLYEYPAKMTPSNFIHPLNLKSHYLHILFAI
ncbi:hypothetical protein KEQ09_24475, partial [Escherichia coli]|nr:hypothetical protein [Escherichia coli]